MLFTDYRTSNESMLAKYSHLLPIQPSRASNLLPSLLGGTCSQTRWVTPTISTAVIFVYKPGKTQVLSISGDTANLMEAGYAIHSLVLVFNIFFNDHQTCISVSLNQHHIHLIYGSQYPLKWTEPVKLQSCLVYRQ